MRIAIDMDNTIIDELGATLRPGILEFLDQLSRRHELVLWSNSKRSRVYDMLSHFGIRKYFAKLVAREDYDPEEEGLRKNIGAEGCDMLIDDDPGEIAYARLQGKKGVLVEPYRKNRKMDGKELSGILRRL